MSEIKKGDLVMVVRTHNPPCGCYPGGNGKIFKVAAIRVSPGLCSKCNRQVDGGFSAVAEDGDSYQFYRLKKIDPPAQDETEQRREELTA